MIPLVLWLILAGKPIVFSAAIAALILLALHEFYDLLPAPLALPGKWLGLLLGACLPFAGGNPRFPWPEFFLAGSLLLGLISLLDSRSLEIRARNWTHALFGLIYVALPLSLLVPLRFDPLSGIAGEYRLFFLLVPQWLQDTAAFFIGSRWGRHRMAPAISPKKSWEGAAAGLAAALAGSLLIRWFAFPAADHVTVLVYGLLLGAAGQASDLAESLFKRAVGVKDSSRIIPGHGGVLDRIDGLLFACPVYWLLLRYWPW